MNAGFQRPGKLCWQIVLQILVVATLIFATGCVSKAKAKTDAQKAFMAGQQQAVIMRGNQPALNTVTIVGPVQNPSLKWVQGLTIAQAIVKAGYNSQTDPKSIMIVRGGQAVPVEPSALLSGQDVPLLPGDMVVLQQ